MTGHTQEVGERDSLLVYKSELAVDSTAGDELGGLDLDVFGRRAVGHLRVETTRCHQTGQT